ncbi:adenylate kinase [Phycisphaerales bacterium]|nr:adenylate kinase [Phycisphaerales bacterium]
MSGHYQTVLLFGPPGVGKGTQGEILARIPGFFHSSTGSIFRSLDMNSDIGRIFYQYSSRGELVPDDVTIKIWSQHTYANTIIGLFKPDQDLLVLDGLPRNPKQAKLLYKYISVLKIINLVCRDREALFERMKKRALKQNRADDAKDEVIRRRFEVYEAETRPVLECYDPDLITEVDAMGAPAQVLSHILDAVVPIQNGHFKNPLGGT